MNLWPLVVPVGSAAVTADVDAEVESAEVGRSVSCAPEAVASDVALSADEA